MKMKPKSIIISILVALLVILFAQNTQIVDVQFLFWSITMSRIILLAIVIFISFLLGYFTHIILSKRKKK